MESKLTTLMLADAVEKFSEDQPRDENGRFGSGGGSKEHAEKATKTAMQKTKLANNSKRAADHREAARAHTAAAKAHSDAGDHKQAEVHREMAETHAARAAGTHNRTYR
jgi:hypothetical protein